MNSRSTNGLALKLSVLPLSCLFFSADVGRDCSGRSKHRSRPSDCFQP